LLLYFLAHIYSVTSRGFLNGIDNDQIAAGYENPACKTVVETPIGELKPEPEYGSPCWPVFMYRSLYGEAGATANDFLANRVRKLAFAAGINLLLWLVIVAALYAAGAIVAWVIRGFRSKPIS
jgi:hypothetical protein